MCGIAGFLTPGRGHSAQQLRALAISMAKAIAHRGPDDGGAWVDPAFGIALGHRRLSILDLSPLGHQPMHSADERYVIAFNGEIYNYRALRDELGSLGHRFRGHSDTEILLAALCQWGFAATLPRLNGMFAIALWDRQDGVLRLARDRLGEKPLYYGTSNGTHLFGSELKAIRAHPAFHGTLDRGALALYLQHNYVPSPYCIFEGFRKLIPGTYVTVTKAGFSAPVRYWSARQAALEGVADRLDLDDREATDHLDVLLRDAVRLRMESDVPLGAFLSGGIDSSTVVALMQAQSDRPVQTFSIGFHEARFNEADHAKAVAHHLRTSHTELYVRAEDAQAIVPSLPGIYDEPFADSSQIPTILVSQLARRSVTVSLSGDGGDEFFGGYPRYATSETLWNSIRRVPGPLRKPTARAICALPLQSLGGALRTPALERRAQKLSKMLVANRPHRMYTSLVSHWADRPATIYEAPPPPTALTDGDPSVEGLTFFEWMMYVDTLTYLPDDILTKVDRASMSVALEARVPLLDHRVLEFAWRLPLHMRRRHGQGKWLLRQVLYRYVPRALVERPKMGFGVPVGEWLRGPLRDWADNLLDEGRLRREGLLNVEAVREKWAEHLAGVRDWQSDLWVVLMLEAWLDAWPEVSSGANEAVRAHA